MSLYKKKQLANLTALHYIQGIASSPVFIDLHQTAEKYKSGDNLTLLVKMINLATGHLQLRT
jgi:hypothetical protein